MKLIGRIGGDISSRQPSNRVCLIYWWWTGIRVCLLVYSPWPINFWKKVIFYAKIYIDICIRWSWCSDRSTRFKARAKEVAPEPIKWYIKSHSHRKDSLFSKWSILELKTKFSGFCVKIWAQTTYTQLPHTWRHNSRAFVMPLFCINCYIM